MTYQKATPPPLYTTDSDGRYTTEVRDNVYNPPHYKQGKVECIEAIQSALTEEEFRGYCKGNALKYIWREKHKGGKESLEKAAWYLDYMMQGV